MFNLFNTLISANVFSFISLLDLLCLLSIMFGVYVINSKNPIVSVLFLIALFVSISLNLILLGYNFIGLSYLLVYVGAISILFLFILMLINVRTSELLNDTNNGIPLALYAGLLFSYPFFFTLNKDNTIVDSKKILSLPSGAPSGTKDDNKKSFEDIIFYDDTQLSFCVLSPAGKDNIKNQDFKGVLLNKKDSELYYASSNAWDNNLTDINDITSIGNVLYSTYGVWLIICSIILLLAMIGAITITKKEKD